MKKRCVLINSFLVFLSLATAFPTLATGLESTTTVTLEQSTHFLAADGSDVLVKPGSYEIEAADTWLRLIPGERRDALLLEAHPYHHKEILHTPKAVVTEREENGNRISLLLPGGKGLEAIGSMSGIRSRAVTRARTSRSTSRTPQKSRQPTQSIDVSVRVQKLENQVRVLQATINALQSRLNKMESAIQVNSGNVTVNGNTVKIVSSMVDVRAATSKFSGMVKADTVNTKSVISSSYTPGAGNIW